MKKLSNKGFTLIELLATILIIGVVLGLTAYGIISSVNNAKDQSTILSIKNIKESARTYSGEYNDDTWKKSNTSNNIYFCVTIEELINKGLLNKKATSVEDSNIKLNDYIAVTKDYVTKVIKKEEVLTNSSINKEAYEYCTGNIKPEDIVKSPDLKNIQTYTDTIITGFTDAEFSTKDNEITQIKERKCGYSKTSGGDYTWSKASNNVCNFTGLKSNDGYYIKVCMTSEYGSQSCSSTYYRTTKSLIAPSINKNTENSIKITYDDSNILDENGNHYFKSNIKAVSDKELKQCILSNTTNNYVCDKVTNEISKNTWYKVSDKEVILTYTNSGNITVTAENRDKSNNSKSSEKSFSSYKIIFNKGTADTIDGQTNNIEKLCLANVNGKCSITSPSIEKANHKIIGWNTNSNVKTSSWDVNTSKNINKNETYYPITELNKIKITINANGGTGGTSTIWYYYGVNKIYSDEACTKEINKINVSTRTGYTLKHYYGDGTSGGTNGERYIYDDGSFAEDLVTDIYKDATFYADWNINKIKIKYNMNGGSLNSNNSSFGTSGSYITLNGSTIIETYNYGDKLGTDGLYNYNNTAYINIVRDGYYVVSGEEWFNQEGIKFSQAIVYNANDLCNASNSDCEVTLYVNWNKVDHYKATFDTNGGKFSDGTTSYVMNATIGKTYYFGTDTPTPTKTNCTFSGWYMSPYGGGPYSQWFRLDDGDGDQIFTAAWKCSSGQYQIAFYSNGGYFTTGETLYTTKININQTYYFSNLGIPGVSKSGYYLDGWHDGSIYGTIFRSHFYITENDTNQKFYANWVSNGSSSGDSGGKKYQCDKCIRDKDCYKPSRVCNVSCQNSMCVWTNYKADGKTCATNSSMCY